MKKRGPKSKVDRERLRQLVLRKQNYAEVGRRLGISGERVRQISAEMGLKMGIVAHPSPPAVG